MYFILSDIRYFYITSNVNEWHYIYKLTIKKFEIKPNVLKNTFKDYVKFVKYFELFYSILKYLKIKVTFLIVKYQLFIY